MKSHIDIKLAKRKRLKKSKEKARELLKAMKQPQMRKIKTLRKMNANQWKEHISTFFICSEYKGKPLPDFDGCDTSEVAKYLREKEKEYTEAKINKSDTDFIKAEIIHCKQILAGRGAKYPLSTINE